MQLMVEGNTIPPRVLLLLYETKEYAMAEETARDSSRRSSSGFCRIARH